MCGKHGALFELGTGMCIEGPCKGRGLVPVPLAIIDNDICVVGVKLAEDIDEDAEEGECAGE
jgi:nitrite reductase/ring-hydroxylating ferredoxin subunit